MPKSKQTESGEAVVSIWSHPMPIPPIDTLGAMLRASDILRPPFHLELARVDVAMRPNQDAHPDLAHASRVCPEHGGERFLESAQIPMNQAVKTLMSLISIARSWRIQIDLPADEIVPAYLAGDLSLGTIEQRCWLSIERAAGWALALRIRWDDETHEKLEQEMEVTKIRVGRRPAISWAAYAVRLLGSAARFRQPGRGAIIQAEGNERAAAREVNKIIKRMSKL